MRASAARNAYLRLRGMQELGVLVALIVLCAALSFSTTTFLDQTNLLRVARQASYIGIMSVGMVFVICMGDIDLSVGSILTLSNIIAGLALFRGFPVAVAVLAGLVAGALCGFINGALAVVLRIPTIIVTLGTLSIYRGVALIVCGNAPISRFSKTGAFFTIGGGELFRIPTSVIIMIAVAAAGWAALTRTVFGRHVQAIGGNPVSARLSGIPLSRYRIGVMSLNGAIAALAGIIALAFLQSADPTTGQGFELWVIASVIIGGTALSGGYGSVPGAILGALIIYVIHNGLVLLSAPTNTDIAVTGGAIVVAVAIDAFVRRRAQART